MWWPCLNIVPTQFDTLMSWSTQELAELQGSAVVEKIGKDVAEKNFRASPLSVVQSHSLFFSNHSRRLAGLDADSILFSLAYRVAILIMAYGFDLEEEPKFRIGRRTRFRGWIISVGPRIQQRHGLAGLFNADRDLNNVSQGLQPHLMKMLTCLGSSTLIRFKMTMVALRPIQKGQQISNDFGQLLRSDLLRRYGYITDHYK